MQDAATILLVEDNPNDVLLIQRAFRKANVLGSLRVLNDGDSAVHYLTGEGPYANRLDCPLPVLLLLDLKLPRKSGLEVLVWLRKQRGIGRLPTVVLTSSNQPVDIDRAYEAGANSYLVKPVQFDDLLAVIRTLKLYWLVLNERPELAP